MPSHTSWAAAGPSQPASQVIASRWRALWPRRSHQREWAGVAAALLLASLLFSLWPALDTTVSTWFFDGHGFVGKQSDLVMAVYWLVPWLGRAVALAGLALLLLRWWRGGLLWGWRARRVVVVACAMGLGVGALVNYALKEHSGRPRPVDTLQFGGAARFEPALSFAGSCTRNCSFVSGHAATGFVLMAWGLWGSPATRRRWWWRGLLLGALVGAGRVMQGGHFVSDVVFAGLAMVLACLLQRALWVRWRALRRARWRAAAAAAAAGAVAAVPTAG
jgi:lipid A 4'-phosphatase